METRDVWAGLQALKDARYIDWHRTARFTETVRTLIAPSLRERGRRALGRWPGDEPLRDLIAVIERLIASSEPEERTRLERLRAALLGLGEKVGTAVAIAWAKACLGLASNQPPRSPLVSLSHVARCGAGGH
jgi:hypothetical protein